MDGVMKNTVTSLLLVLAVGATSLSAQSCAATRRDDEASSGLLTATYGSREAFVASNGLVKDTFVVKVAGAPRA